MLYGAQKGRWKNVEEAAQAMKEYMLENMLDSYPEIDRSDAEHRRKRIWAQAVKEGSLRLPKQADILEDGRRDLRYALQVSSLFRLGLLSSISGTSYHD